VIIPCGEKAIWSAAIEGEGWSHDLTLIKVATHKIWTNPTQRPNDFEGNIVVAEIKSLEENDEPTVKADGLEGEIQQDEGREAENVLLEKVEYKSLEPIRQNSSTTLEDDLDLLAFLPSVNEENCKESEAKEATADEMDKYGIGSNNIKPKTKSTKNNIEMDQVTQFFEWLHKGIENGVLKTNQAKARIHTVDEGVILITPGIFQDFAKTQDDEATNWTIIQKKVLKKN